MVGAASGETDDTVVPLGWDGDPGWLVPVRSGPTSASDDHPEIIHEAAARHPANGGGLVKAPSVWCGRA
ncbi:hypothetical protein AEQ27_01480 [Frigoribacterium sp. RIT-PI-h]|nr:hypothetical protein AEQ27_01480 [Frigoribacterium sp. RIT-PI-h]